MKEIIENDCVYFIGRNAKDNDLLFNKMSDDDLWFHLDDRPSCHVYIKKNDSEDFTKESISRAVQLTREYSKCFDSKVKICYLEKKYLKKTKVPGTLELSKKPNIY